MDPIRPDPRDVRASRDAAARSLRCAADDLRKQAAGAIDPNQTPAFSYRAAFKVVAAALTTAAALLDAHATWLEM